MRYLVTVGGQERRVLVRRAKGAGYWISVGEDEEVRVEAHQLGAAEWAVQAGGQLETVACALQGEIFHTQNGGRAWTGTVVDPRRMEFKGSEANAQGCVVTPMPGIVVRISVEVGQEVEAGDVLCVVEAMKMENEYRSEVGGVVEEVHVAEGVAVVAQTRLITVRAREA
jgi:biotin carboxyl carrier protein